MGKGIIGEREQGSQIDGLPRGSEVLSSYAGISRRDRSPWVEKGSYPFHPKPGLMKPRRGLTPVAGKKKLEFGNDENPILAVSRAGIDLFRLR